MNSGLTGKRVLVVEDESMVAWALEDMLVEMGCEVVGPAASVNEALGMIETEALDAAMLDVNLNGQKSYAVANALTARGLPFIFCTGYRKKRLRSDYMSVPMLQKPIERTKLGVALANLLNSGTPTTSEQVTRSAVWDAHRLRVATDAAGVGLWWWNVDTDEFDMDERAHGLWGVSGGPVTFAELSARIHPEDLDRVRAAFAATREIIGAYEIDFRILHSKEVRWVSARGRGDDQGIVGRTMFGVFLDVTERKLAEEAREMLAGEMGHRVKNLFAIATALTTLAARSTTTSAEMSQDLIQRLTALNRAHDLVRPVISQPKKAARLADLLTVLLAPYTDEVAADSRVSKYGALSKADGSVHVEGVVDDKDVVITWTEVGGPPVAAARGPAGFGSQLVTRSISNQLGGTIAFDWRTEGVIVTLRTSRARLGT